MDADRYKAQTGEFDREDEKEDTSKLTGVDGLYRKGAKPPRKKYIKPDPKMETLKKATLFKETGLQDEEILARKTKTTKDLFEYEKKQQMMDRLEKVEFEDKRITKPVDTKIITAKTLETLFKYFDLEVGESRTEMDRKLNKQWIHEQKLMPDAKLKKTKIDAKGQAEVVEGDASDTDGIPTDSEEEEAPPAKEAEESGEESGSGGED
jgi:hypothetical protein